MDSERHDWGETLVVDGLGRLVELDDRTATCLTVPIQRALGRPLESVIDPGLADAVASAIAIGVATWRGRTIRAKRSERGTVIEFDKDSVVEPTHADLFADVALASTLEEIRRILEATGPRIAIAGTLSVQAGSTGQWVPVAAWGGGAQSPFTRTECIALRTGLPSVSTPESALRCRHWQPSEGLLCVPVHNERQPMLVSVAGCGRETAEALARALLGRTTHPDWQG
ncbi:MAG: hypothetical protein AB7F50_02215 [Fimbriimonadaceae bacterium]